MAPNVDFLFTPEIKSSRVLSIRAQFAISYSLITRIIQTNDNPRKWLMNCDPGIDYCMVKFIAVKLLSFYALIWSYPSRRNYTKILYKLSRSCSRFLDCVLETYVSVSFKITFLLSELNTPVWEWSKTWWRFKSRFWF